ncbi:hypothetical protein ASPWEDRAFT_522965 [Aspergillus wentii DTO 134E9]|uniref:Uncharacterized protein n=1 Tax=Aspergillus wentii DTO 134E9 TaxID=1073089 RepID=A0A1L9RLB3_ASPWE|nr:uncharacterized protein ASPWEDRAFT_522965 [Aspergillus wentii DTO 134E9]OJJ35711.1 hypothetical protein ASPWEDRAFT_522965 [Aspergillus wentii DTO 134E9]
MAWTIWSGSASWLGEPKADKTGEETSGETGVSLRRSGDSGRSKNGIITIIGVVEVSGDTAWPKGCMCKSVIYWRWTMFGQSASVLGIIMNGMERVFRVVIGPLNPWLTGYQIDCIIIIIIIARLEKTVSR